MFKILINKRVNLVLEGITLFILKKISNFRKNKFPPTFTTNKQNKLKFGNPKYHKTLL
jgi:hypothetical protein